MLSEIKLLSSAFICVSALYLTQYFWNGGRSYVSPDGVQYVELAEGRTIGPPMNNRIFKPKFASFVASCLSIDPVDAFRLLTPIEFLGSLIAITYLIRRFGGTLIWQVSIILAVGFPLAVLFGHTPILVDTMLLLLASLCLVALECNHLVLAMALACLASLTKEYGILLGLPWMVYSYRRGGKLSLLAGPFPALILFINTRLHSDSVGTGAGGLLGFFQGAINYMKALFQAEYAYKTVYIWMWTALWPLLLAAFLSLLARFKEKVSYSSIELSFAAMIIASPLLLIGDWDRSLLIIAPFTCAAVSGRHISKDRQFACLVAVGGMATALANPFFSFGAPDKLIKPILIIVSFMASIALLLRIFSTARLQASGRLSA